MSTYNLYDLRLEGYNASTNFSRANSLYEAKTQHFRTIFLCHSHHDRRAAIGLKRIIEAAGGSLYIDWMDDAMPDTPDRTTAERIRSKIVENDVFMFLATPNSMASRWCPWEIGYADGKKPNDSIVIVQTIDDGRYYGNEYLQLYRRLEMPPPYSHTPTVIRPNQHTGVAVTQL